MKIVNPQERLFSLWGIIDAQHNRLITLGIKGKNVLDVGCGYGSLVDYLTERGYKAKGIDISNERIKIAKQLFPNGRFQTLRAEKCDRIIAKASVDTIVLKDSLHHLVGEGDIKNAMKNFKVILKKSGRIVVLDPNPTIIVRLARKIIHHKDFKVTFSKAIKLFKKEGFQVKEIFFFEIIGILLSGGYIGIRFVPNYKLFNKLVAFSNLALSRLLNKIGLGKLLCWRYCIYADKLS